MVSMQIKRAGFSAPTPIQAQAWPIAMAGRDMVAIAKTGAGLRQPFALATAGFASCITVCMCLWSLDEPRFCTTCCILVHALRSSQHID